MKEWKFEELNEKYDLEIDRILDEIKKQKAKKVLLQFPEGLKPYAQGFVDELERRTKRGVEFIIWLGTCFGACDVPLEVERLGIDLIIQFGHSEWNFE